MLFMEVFMEESTRRRICLPDYTLGEELFNAISHGLGALLSIAGLVLMLLRAHGVLPVVSVCVFGVSALALYTISCLYHSLSPRCPGKRVLRVIDHCNVYLLVLGTYLPVSLLGVRGAAGWVLLGVVLAFSALGITFTAINVDRYQLVSVFCHLVCGWSILFGVPALLRHMGPEGLGWLVAGGVCYTVGSVLYGLGKSRKYRHSAFHLFCLLGSFCHFWSVYAFLL